MTLPSELSELALSNRELLGGLLAKFGLVVAGPIDPYGTRLRGRRDLGLAYVEPAVDESLACASARSWCRAERRG